MHYLITKEMVHATMKTIPWNVIGMEVTAVVTMSIHCGALTVNVWTLHSNVRIIAILVNIGLIKGIVTTLMSVICKANARKVVDCAEVQHFLRKL